MGDRYEYSKAGYSLLAAIIEVVTGSEYEAFLRNNLFVPAGMHHTGLKLLNVPDDLFCVGFSNAPIEDAMPVDDIVDNLSRMAMGTVITMPPEVADIRPGDIEALAGTYFLDDGLLHVSLDNGQMRLAAEGQAVIDLLFPSAYAAMLPRYNGLTSELIGHIAAGRFRKAAEYFGDMAEPLAWRSMIREWWESFDGLGAYRGTDILGTIAAGEGEPIAG
ncbi:MAG: serine hydrolase [Candidatus Zixiibacteriota bacterium]|nr:MAG: serine hydrolase [candidate division Zixibacteria bacterium]